MLLLASDDVIGIYMEQKNFTQIPQNLFDHRLRLTAGWAETDIF